MMDAPNMALGDIVDRIGDIQNEIATLKREERRLKDTLIGLDIVKNDLVAFRVAEPRGQRHHAIIYIAKYPFRDESKIVVRIFRDAAGKAQRAAAEKAGD